MLRVEQYIERAKQLLDGGGQLTKVRPNSRMSLAEFGFRDPRRVCTDTRMHQLITHVLVPKKIRTALVSKVEGSISANNPPRKDTRDSKNTALELLVTFCRSNVAVRTNTNSRFCEKQNFGLGEFMPPAVQY